MTEGYPDYSRIGLAGGYQLFAVNGTAPENTILFQGYVGNWPYLNLYTNLASGSDFYQFYMVYYSDATFTTQVGFRVAVRETSDFSVTQYGNISNWMVFYYLSKSGAAFTGSNVSLVATAGYVPDFNMASNDVPIFFFSGQITASSNSNEFVQHITPGPGHLHWYTTATTWTINVQLYNYGAGAFQTIRVLSNGVELNHGTIDLSMLDCPYQFNLVNGDAANRTYIVTWEPA